MKSLIISDSFKGTLSSKEIGEIFSEVYKDYFNDGLIIKEIADGGEGTIDALYENINGEFIHLKAKDPYFKIIDSKYLVKDDTAYIELATTAGITLIDKLNPCVTTTYGVGEQIKDAIERGYKKIVIGCGGSATNDAGLGALSAIGFKFYDFGDKEFIPVGETISHIKRIDTRIKEELKDIKFTIMSDCINKMHGKFGASYVYAPQKGASKEDVVLLDKNLKYLDKFFKRNFNRNVSWVDGSGAAGAFPSSFLALLDTTVESGIEVILKSMDFDNLIKDVDYIFTGEGKLDYQTNSGKVISGILNHTRKQNKKVIIVAGMIDSKKKIDGVYKMYSTSNGESWDYIKTHAKEMYKNKIKEVLEELK